MVNRPHIYQKARPIQAVSRHTVQPICVPSIHWIRFGLILWLTAIFETLMRDHTFFKFQCLNKMQISEIRALVKCLFFFPFLTHRSPITIIRISQPHNNISHSSTMALRSAIIVCHSNCDIFIRWATWIYLPQVVIWIRYVVVHLHLIVRNNSGMVFLKFIYRLLMPFTKPKIFFCHRQLQPCQCRAPWTWLHRI